MTQPDDTPQVLDGTDITADPQDEPQDEPEHKAATTDPEQMTDEGRLGGVAGSGGAG